MQTTFKHIIYVDWSMCFGVYVYAYVFDMCSPNTGVNTIQSVAEHRFNQYS